MGRDLLIVMTLDKISSIPLCSLMDRKMQIWVYLKSILEEEKEKLEDWMGGWTFLWETTLKVAF